MSAIQQVLLGYGGASADPYFGNVKLLLHGDGTNGGTTHTDSSSYGRTPAVTGTVTTVTDAGSFGGSAISFSSSAANYLTYTDAGFLSSTTSMFTLEFYIDLSVAYTTSYFDGKSAFVRCLSSGSRVVEFSCAGGGVDQIYVSSNNQTNSVAVTNRLSRMHLAVCRNASATGLQVWVDGLAVVGVGCTSFNIDTIMIGNMHIYPTHPSAGVIEEIRLTDSHERYTSTFTPGGPFPDS